MAVNFHFLSGVWHPSLSLGTPPPPEPQHPMLTLCPGWEHVSHFSDEKRYSATISVVNSALPSEYPLLHSLWGPNVSTCPDLWGSFWVCKNFSSFMTSFPGFRSPSSNTLSPFKLYFLPYLILRRLRCIFGSLRSSPSVQKVFCKIFSTWRCIF